MLDLHRLRLLREFADRGTIAATAAALGYTASAVSQQLSAQEAQPSGRISVTAFPTAAAAFAPALVRNLRRHPGLTLLLQQAAPGEGLRRVRTGDADVALVDDWSGGLPGLVSGMLRCYPLVRDSVVLIVPRHHALADTTVRVDLRRLRETSRWMAPPAGEPSRQAVDRLLETSGGAPAVPWEFEGLGTIVSLVARGVGVAVVPRLALATGEGRVVVRELPGTVPAREVYAVVRAASVRRPSVAVVLAALATGAGSLPGHRDR